MKRIYPLSLIAFVALSGLGCATVPPPAPKALAELPADATCRNLSTPEGRAQRYCGTAEQWAEVDRRTALINAGFSCRWEGTARELCLSPQQWKSFDRRAQDLAAMVFSARADPVSTVMSPTIGMGIAYTQDGTPIQ